MRSAIAVLPFARVATLLATMRRFSWHVGRASLIVVLTCLEPFVRVTCSLAVILGTVAAVVFEISAVGPGFSFLGMLAASLGFGLALAAYYALLGLLLD